MPGKGTLWFAYSVSVALLIQLCLTITQRSTQGIPLPSPLGEGLGVRPIGAGGEASWVRVCFPQTNKAATKQIVSSLPCNVVKRGRGRDLFAVMFVRNGEFLTTARTASSQNATTILR